jgi:hypothetical protein
MIRLFACLILLLGSFAATALAQAPQPFLQVGVGLVPGTGVQGGYSSPALNVFTQEAYLYADYRPGILTDVSRLLISGGVGASLRTMRVLALTAEGSYDRYDFDLGLRMGPAFAIPFSETSQARRAEAFRLFIDPFARGIIRLDGGRSVFVEVGTQAPVFRGGLVFRP